MGMGIITIVTNNILGGWHPKDLGNGGLGGSEEAISYLAQEFVKIGYQVELYTTLTDGKPVVHKNVEFKNISDFDSAKEYDVFISFKNKEIWKNVKAKNKIHFSLEVETYWKDSTIDNYVFTSNFHRSRMPWVPENKCNVIPLGVNLKNLDKHKTVEKEQNTLLYCSSFDRGLMQLLHDWGDINKDKKYTLKVAYNTKVLEEIALRNPNAKHQLNELKQLLAQEGVVHLGSLNEQQINEEYAKAEYWILPLNNPESELFCLNAVKSRYLGCKSIVNLKGALKETVGDYIDYSDFRARVSDESVAHKHTFIAEDWSEVVRKHWLKLLGGK